MSYDESHRTIPVIQRAGTCLAVAPHDMLRHCLKVAGESFAAELEAKGLMTPETFCEQVMGEACITARHAYVVNAALKLGAPVGSTHVAYAISQFQSRDRLHFFVRVLRYSAARPLPIAIKAGDPVDVLRLFREAVDQLSADPGMHFIAGSNERTLRDFADFILRERLVHISKNAQGSLIADIAKLAADKSNAAYLGGMVQLGPSRRPGHLVIHVIPSSAQPVLS
jgi:hypothetical protein